MTTTPESDLRTLARILAPYIADELGLTKEVLEAAAVDRRTSFDESLCRDYARELSVAALQRGHVFFKALAEDGRINSVTLAERLQFTSSKALAGALTNQLKKAARTLGVEVPWEETEDGDGRTVWLDRDGIAGPLAAAILAELGRRTGA